MPKSGNFSPAFLGSLTPATTLYCNSLCYKDLQHYQNLLSKVWRENHLDIEQGC